jgi:DNA-binding LacI/PurR family transcriptional regulator
VARKTLHFPADIASFFAIPTMIKELVHLNELRTYLPSGLIVIPSSVSDLTKQAEIYKKSGTPVVCVDRLPKRWEGDTVTVANEEGAHEATAISSRSAIAKSPSSPGRCT